MTARRIRDDATVADDDRYLARCLELAETMRGRTSPNPIVGCVIVKDGKVLAEGVHRGPGTHHGEADALAKLGGRAPGATLYCNLEPCNHHGRTPPCAPAVKAAGVARVVYGVDDPIAGHAGGARLLRGAGIAVTSGVLADACEAANRPFLTWARHGRPMFTLKAAVTLDGKIATASGESKWITGEPARADVMRLRDTHDAILVGINTVLADDPALTVRGRPNGRDPRRVILDSDLRTPPRAKVVPGSIIATSRASKPILEQQLTARGATVWRFPTKGNIPLRTLAARLASEGITSVLVEGGGQVHGSFLEAGFADELVLYVAPKLFGTGPGWVSGVSVRKLVQAYQFRFGEPERFGEDLRIVAVPAAATDRHRADDVVKRRR